MRSNPCERNTLVQAVFFPTLALYDIIRGRFNLEAKVNGGLL